jgi:hypothetical protein
MRAAWRCAPIERRLRPAAQPAARTVWPPIGSTDAGPVARPAPWREARTQWPHVVPAGVVHAPLHWVVPNCPRSARGARLGRDHAAPSRPCFTRVHQSAPRFHSRRLAHRGPRCGAKSAVPGAGPAVPSASVGGPTPPGGPRFAAPPPPASFGAPPSTAAVMAGAYRQLHGGTRGGPASAAGSPSKPSRSRSQLCPW